MSSLPSMADQTTWQQFNLEKYNNAIIIDTTDRNTHAPCEAKVDSTPLYSLCYTHVEFSSANQMSRHPERCVWEGRHRPFSQHREHCNTVKVKKKKTR